MLAELSTTGRLEQALLDADEFEEFLLAGSTQGMLEFAEYLGQLCQKRGLTRAEVIRAGRLEHSFAYQVFSGKKHPSRETALRLAFGFGLDIGGAQRLLAHARLGKLYARDRRDSAIMFALKQGLGLDEANDLLYAHGLPTV